MDSLTQLTFGASVGEAALWGGVLGTLPDLDVLLPLQESVEDEQLQAKVD